MRIGGEKIVYLVGFEPFSKSMYPRFLSWRLIFVICLLLLMCVASFSSASETAIGKVQKFLSLKAIRVQKTC